MGYTRDKDNRERFHPLNFHSLAIGPIPAWYKERAALEPVSVSIPFLFVVIVKLIPVFFRVTSAVVKTSYHFITYLGKNYIWLIQYGIDFGVTERTCVIWYFVFLFSFFVLLVYLGSSITYDSLGFTSKSIWKLRIIPRQLDFHSKEERNRKRTLILI